MAHACLDGADSFSRVLVTEPDHPYLDHWWPPGHTLGCCTLMWDHEGIAFSGDYSGSRQVFVISGEDGSVIRELQRPDIDDVGTGRPAGFGAAAVLPTAIECSRIEYIAAVEVDAVGPDVLDPVAAQGEPAILAAAGTAIHDAPFV